jgi:hypothetical protein
MTRSARHAIGELPLTRGEVERRERVEAARRDRDLAYRLALDVPLDGPLPAALGQLGSRAGRSFVPRGKRLA